MFNCHFYNIQEVCKNNQIDFFELCRKVHFRWDMISTGITRIYNETSDLTDVTKNISDNTPVIPSFPEYIQSEKNNEVAELCKKLFSVGHSQKRYAIMFCLLSDKGLITVPDRKRNSYYKAWYLYINIPFPKNNNFYAINKYLFDRAVNGFMFENTSDLDYVQLETAFNKILKSKNIP
jgi:hypothetical protein